MSGSVEGVGMFSGAGRRRALAVMVVVAAVLGACAPAGPAAPIDKAGLDYVKRTVFGAEARQDADRIGAGTQQSVLPFTVEDTPPSIFVNWIVPDAQAAAFTASVNLPSGFSLTKVRILESDPVPRYWLSLNVYRVSGITTGLRAEWSTYVDDGTGAPRFMIVRARAADGSIDPIGPLAPPEPFQHGVNGANVISTAMNKTVIQNGVPVLTPNNLFTSTISLPVAANRQYVTPTREWVAANDYIYWLNGVNDRTFHNSTAHSAPLISVDLADVTLTDESEWAAFVDPVPGHVLVYLDKIQFMIGPWWNVTEPDGRVAPATRSSLLALKKTMYSGLAQIQALSVLSGTAEPIVQSSVQNSPPSVFWHWRIDDAQAAAFAATAHLPGGLSLAKVRLQDDDTEAAYWLTLNVYRVSGATAGLRAEWTTFVNDATGIRTFTMESRAGYSSLNPTSIPSATNPFTAAHPLTHGVITDTVSTTVGTGPTAFASSFLTPAAAPATTTQASREWVGAGDLRYWSNGLADRVFADSAEFGPKTSVDPATVAVTYDGPWSAFADASPDRVWVNRTGVGRVINPWWNLNVL